MKKTSCQSNQNESGKNRKGEHRRGRPVPWTDRASHSLPGKTKKIFHNRALPCGKLSGISPGKQDKARGNPPDVPEKEPDKTGKNLENPGKNRRTPGSVYREETARQNCIRKSNSPHSTAVTVSSILSGASSTVKRTVSPAKAMP